MNITTVSEWLTWCVAGRVEQCVLLWFQARRSTERCQCRLGRSRCRVHLRTLGPTMHLVHGCPQTDPRHRSLTARPTASIRHLNTTPPGYSGESRGKLTESRSKPSAETRGQLLCGLSVFLVSLNRVTINALRNCLVSLNLIACLVF